MNILITGGTGSLGKAVVSKLLKLNTFQRICIYSRDEHKQEQVRAQFNDDERLRFFIGDVRDKDRLKLALENIHYVIHAAALKVVPTAEYNPFEAVKTNILGSQNLIDCITNRDSFVMGKYPKVIAVSTDKAVHPINLYGATKLCAEKLFIAANNIKGMNGPRFSVARYGNVANSNGSVIPLFQRQVADKTQLTITDDRMSRFWITLDEASDFVLRCLNAMYGGEIFVPQMPAFKIKDLALGMMQAAGYAPENQWCKVIGIRPGEKLYEEIITEEETSKIKYLKNQKVYIITDQANYGLEGADTFDAIERKSINSDNVYTMGQDELMQKVKEL